MSKSSFEEEYWSGHSQGLEARHKLALGLIGDANSVLDVGCGDGFFLSFVSASIKKGADMSKVAVDKAKERGIDAQVVDFESKDLPFKFDEFDVVCLLDVLEHTFNPASELEKVSKFGRRVVVTVPNFAFLGSRLSALFGRVPSVLGERKGHCFYFTRSKLREVFSRANIRIVKEDFYFPLMDVPVIGLFSRFFCRLFPSLFATEFAVLGEKL